MNNHKPVPMSRHKFELLDDGTIVPENGRLGIGKELVVGWDGPLASFFAQVFDNFAETEDGYLALDLGCNLKVDSDGNLVEDSIKDAVELKTILETEHNIIIGDEVVEQLIADKLARGSDVTPLQQEQMDFVAQIFGIIREPRYEYTVTVTRLWYCPLGDVPIQTLAMDFETLEMAKSCYLTVTSILMGAEEASDSIVGQGHNTYGYCKVIDGVEWNVYQVELEGHQL